MINILHLYYDLLNLYGENANIRSIVYNLELNNIKTKVDLKSLNDKIDFDKYDIVYIGSGSEDNILLALNDLKERKEDIKKYIEKEEKYFFATGNSITLFGQYLQTNTDKIEGLKLFEYNAKYIEESHFKNASKNRIVGTIEGNTKLIKERIIGFQNRCDIITNTKNTLFKLNENYSNDLKTKNEGYNYKNFYATHIIGPLFVRNPYLLDYFLEKICSKKQLKYKSLDETAKIAYKKYLENFN